MLVSIQINPNRDPVKIKNQKVNIYENWHGFFMLFGIKKGAEEQNKWNEEAALVDDLIFIDRFDEKW